MSDVSYFFHFDLCVSCAESGLCLGFIFRFNYKESMGLPSVFIFPVPEMLILTLCGE